MPFPVYSVRCSVQAYSDGARDGLDSQRVDVHPYEEAQGFQRLLDMPGYDVAALVEKSGKSASHIYARLSLLQLIPAIAEAFTQELITTSHANLFARLPQEFQAKAYEECWRKDWQDKEPHLLPAKHVAAWIQANLYLSLADAPFDREDPTLNPIAGACVTCPRRSGYNTSLFVDVQGDQCLDSACYHCKVEAHLDREIAARPNLVQIETVWRNPKQQRPGILERGQFREIEPVTDNPDAEPILPCAATKTAIIVFGKRVGTTLTVCTDLDCPVHYPRTVKERVSHPAPVMSPPAEAETQAEAEERQEDYEQRRKEFEEEQERKAEERKQEFQRQQEEYEAESSRKADILKARQITFERVLGNAPPMFTAPQFRVFLRTLCNLDPYTFTDEVVEHFAGDDENNQHTPEEILATALADVPDEKLTSFALRLALTGYVDIPREDEFDFLAEAEAAFVPPPSEKKKPKAKKQTPTKATPTAEPKVGPKKIATPKRAVAA